MIRLCGGTAQHFGLSFDIQKDTVRTETANSKICWIFQIYLAVAVSKNSKTKCTVTSKQNNISLLLDAFHLSAHFDCHSGQCKHEFSAENCINNNLLGFQPRRMRLCLKNTRTVAKE